MYCLLAYKQMVGVPPVRRTAPLLQPPCLHPQGGDCAKSFKEFKANNIHGTFRVLLQMGDVLVFGGQVPIVKVQIDCPNQIDLNQIRLLVI